MDVKDLLESLDYSKENINRQALVYSFSNILTLSILSGFGIKYDLSEETIEDFINKSQKKNGKKIIKDTEVDTSSSMNQEDPLKVINEQLTSDDDFIFIKDLIPVKAIYSRTKLNNSFHDDIKKNTGIDLKINNKKSKMKLKPKNQGLLILNEVNLAKYLYNKSVIRKNKEASTSEKFIGMLLFNSAIEQGLFCQNNLRNSKGFFIAKDNVSQDPSKINLKEIKNKIDWEDQVCMLWAYAKLYETLENNNFKRYSNLGNAKLFKDYAFNILNLLKTHEEEIIDLDTSSFSSLTSSIIEALNIIDKEKKNLKFVLSLCDELYIREKQKGFMVSSRYINQPASLASHFKSIEALTNGFLYTNLDLFLNTSEKIYSNLNRIWDDNIGLFKLDRNHTVKYSSKSISYVLKSLNKLSRTTNSLKVKENISNQLNSFFDSSINETGIQASPPSLNKSLNMLRSPETITSVIENMIEDKGVYVIEKGFELPENSNKIIKYSNEFSCEHALYASDAMLSLAME
ncbi:hypothetical protein [Maledivibacter halophilus]|uniref:Uncharacterized protein n=1 Tax=Maledivibacter halophilus TaxID=36842 RepID=A0A1T5MWC2_9FIRM|nr:hypothetical protein [Maledivibacter halophilus]SKC92502.1 hypothetical protein SAMN02194393_05496 [Maledivibacter halophilus]